MFKKISIKILFFIMLSMSCNLIADLVLSDGGATGTWYNSTRSGEDGTSIIGGNLSTCDGQTAFDSNLDGITNELRNCKSTASCEGVWPIVDGQFTCINELGEMAIGTFTSPTSASGWAFEGEAGHGEYCSAPWTASPE